MDAWRRHLLDTDDALARVVRDCRRIAVLGIKPESRRDQPAFYVPAYMAAHGYDIVPVPVYYPDVTAILGRRVYRTLRDVPGPVDMVNVFRRTPDIPPHLPDLLAARPRVVWLQLGIRHDGVAAELARAGIEVIQDRCLLVEHGRLAGARS
jgi:predicted CoA-binding protein